MGNLGQVQMRKMNAISAMRTLITKASICKLSDLSINGETVEGGAWVVDSLETNIADWTVGFAMMRAVKVLNCLNK